jgi:hypothetical protein
MQYLFLIEHARMTTPPNASKIIKLVKYLGFLAHLSPLQHNCQKDNIICAIDLGLDWNFHAEINSTEQKIQHKTELRYAILVFAIFGSKEPLKRTISHTCHSVILLKKK